MPAAFTERRQKAIEAVGAILDRLFGRPNARLPVCDTGAAQPAHGEIIEERRRHNAAVARAEQREIECVLSWQQSVRELTTEEQAHSAMVQRAAWYGLRLDTALPLTHPINLTVVNYGTYRGDLVPVKCFKAIYNALWSGN